MMPTATMAVMAAGTFLAPDDRARVLTEDWDLGGAAINDPSQGLQVQSWRAWLDGDTVYVAPESGLPVTTLFSEAGITELSLAFDQNMHATVAYVAGGVCKLRWHDSTIGGTATTTFADATSPFLCLDDKRDLAASSSDVLFFYLKAGSLNYRQQRDRYGVECWLADVALERITNCGMTDGNRIQVTLE